LECGAIQDVLEVCGAIPVEENARAREVLDRIVAMLTKLGRRGYTVREEGAGYCGRRIDSDSDTDSDPERNPGCSTRPAPKGRGGADAARPGWAPSADLRRSAPLIGVGIGVGIGIESFPKDSN